MNLWEVGSTSGGGAYKRRGNPNRDQDFQTEKSSRERRHSKKLTGFPEESDFKKAETLIRAKHCRD